MAIVATRTARIDSRPRPQALHRWASLAILVSALLIVSLNFLLVLYVLNVLLTVLAAALPGDLARVVAVVGIISASAATVLLMGAYL